MDSIARRLEALAGQIPQVEPTEARALMREGALLVDVREPHEVADGAPVGALHLRRGFLELEIDRAVPDPETPLVLMCGGGQRSLLSAATLKELGYTRVHNLSGGFGAWRDAGLPVAREAALGDTDYARYARHLAIPDVGEAGQRKLKAGRVLIIGAGGLGSPVALYLAAAGVGNIGLVDDDVVERSNLQRQILHSDHLIGHPKTESASGRIHALNPDIEVITHPVRLNRDNVDSILEPWDVVVDGADNFPTRYLLNDACMRLGKPMVYGAVFRFSGQIAVFRPGGGACYRCLFPEAPPPEEAPSCAEAGVLGVIPGVIGCLQATEVLKLLLGIGEVLEGRLLNFDGLSGRFRETGIERDPDCPGCATGNVGYQAGPEL